MSDRVEQALKRFKLAAEAEASQRTREKDDLGFQVPENQWPEEVRASRAAQSVNGVPIPARPMLSIPTLDQPLQLVLNQERAARLGVQVHALSEEADDDTAEVLQGLYRRIEVDSRANLARSWAFERAVKCGRGAYRVLTEYDPYGGHPSDQKIVIKRILRQESAFFDPFAQEPDWSDGEFAFVIEDMPLRKYKRLYGDKKKADGTPLSALADYDSSEFDALGLECPGWVGGTEEESRTVRVAEYFYIDYDDETLQWIDAEGKPQSRNNPKRTVKWCKLNAVEELEERDLDGEYIPLIPVIGRELIPFDGERRWVGMIAPQKDAVRLFNYAASGAVETAALEPKAPFDVDPKEIEGYESWWAQANTRNFPYLPRHKVLMGQPTGPLQRIQADTSKLQVNLMLLEKANEFIHTGTGAFEPSLGQESTKAKSGRAILSLQNQHDEGNSNWLDNLAEISLTYEAKVVLDLIPHVYDRPGRVARTLDLEDNAQTVMLNAPFIQGPNGRPQAVNAPNPMQGQTPAAAARGPMGPMGGQPQQPQQPKVKHYDLKKGRYGVTVSVGKAYKSRVEQGADELGQLFQAEPQLFSILGDIYLKFRDFPGHMEASERVKKMLPPQLQQHDEADAVQQVAQMQAQLQAQGQQLQQAVEYIKNEQAKHDAAIQIAKVKAETDESIAHINNAAKIEVARISAAKEAIDADAAAQEELLATGIQHAHDANQAALDRQHQVQVADQQHQQALQQGQQQAVTGAAQSAQEHQQGLEAGAQGIDGQLQVQAAAPQPEAGA